MGIVRFESIFPLLKIVLGQLSSGKRSFAEYRGGELRGLVFTKEVCLAYNDKTAGAG